MSISAKDVMALRQRTGLGMMDCKAALQETNGDMEAAIELLRSKLKGKMDERTDRAAAEGRIAIETADDHTAAAIAELNTETDFTARNDKFGEATRQVAAHALDKQAGEVTADDKVNEYVDQVRITTGENASFRRAHKVEGAFCGAYLHHNEQLGVIVQFSDKVDADTATGICQHIAAHVPVPMGVSDNDIPADVLEKQREYAKKEAEESGKPANIAEKMVEGKIRKFIAENTLLNQKYVKDPEGKKTVKEILPSGVSVEMFVRYKVGE